MSIARFSLVSYDICCSHYKFNEKSIRRTVIYYQIYLHHTYEYLSYKYSDIRTNALYFPFFFYIERTHFALVT